MRILIGTMQVPFVSGGAEALVQALQRELIGRGHQADIIQMPLDWQTRVGLLKGYLTWRLLDLSVIEGQKVDLLIATKFPSFVSCHPNKVTWLVQQLRQVYDLYATEYSIYGHQPDDRAVQQMIQRADTQALKQSRRLFAISQNVADRLAHYNGLQAEVLYPPPRHDGQFHHGAYGDYVLAVSRLDVMKRLGLLVQAMSHVRSDIRCLIAGTGPEENPLKRRVQEARVGRRVEFLGYVGDAQLLSLYANALAVFYAPYDEDYGYVTVEAMKSQKPVLTTSESGGVLEFVQDGVTGFVTPPDDSAAMAQRIDELYLDRRLAERLGRAAQERVASITWETAIKRLLDV